MKIIEVTGELVRPKGYGIWGSSHSYSQAITGEAARKMNLQGYRMPPEPHKQMSGLAHSFLDAISKSKGSPEPLYHSFQNRRQQEWKIGAILDMPLTATSGDKDNTGYGRRLDPKDQEGETTVLEFPAGTPFAGYSKWNKADAEDFGYKWGEAIVAGRFRISNVRQDQEHTWRDIPGHTVVTLVPVAIFDPNTQEWRQL